MQNLLNKILSSPKEKLLCVSTTANINNPVFYIGSVRETDTTIAGNIIIRDTSVLDEIVKVFDGKVDYFLVDCEIKNEVKNLEALMLEKVKESKVFIYKPNDFTIESLDVFLSLLFLSLRGKKVLILGAGNIGSKISLKLCERGAHAFLHDRDIRKTQTIIGGLNLIKRSDLLIKSAEDPIEAAKNADLILGCTSGTPIVSQGMVCAMNKDGKIIDAGNGTIEPDAITLAKECGIEVLSFSSMGGYIGLIENWLFQRKFFEKKRERSLGANSLIIPGVLGKRGDIIVDDVDLPSKLIGMCDGKGDIIPKEDSREILKDILSKIEDKSLVFQIEQIYSNI